MELDALRGLQESVEPGRPDPDLDPARFTHWLLHLVPPGETQHNDLRVMFGEGMAPIESGGLPDSQSSACPAALVAGVGDALSQTTPGQAGPSWARGSPASGVERFAQGVGGGEQKGCGVLKQ